VFTPELLERVYAWPLTVVDDPATGSRRVVPLRSRR
jgi:hypothetical protein